MHAYIYLEISNIIGLSKPRGKKLFRLTRACNIHSFSWQSLNLAESLQYREDIGDVRRQHHAQWFGWRSQTYTFLHKLPFLYQKLRHKYRNLRNYLYYFAREIQCIPAICMLCGSMHAFQARNQKWNGCWQANSKGCLLESWPETRR